MRAAPAKAIGFCLAAAAVWSGAGAAPQRHPLPIYFEDSHAGTFQFLAATLDLEQEHVLVLIDAHSDSTESAGADSLREGIRRVASRDELQNRLISWRRAGRIQSYDWIAPLMPKPVTRVFWVSPSGSGKPPASTVGRQFSIASLQDLEARLPADLPVVVSIDLDFFAGQPAADQKRAFARVWETLVRLPRLMAVSFALSRPWLKDDDEASRLATAAIKAALSLADADLRLEPFGIEGPDRSDKAREFYRAKQSPPRFDLERIEPELRSLLLANADRIRVELSADRWQDTLKRWRAESAAWRIELEGIDAGADGIYRPSPDSSPALHIVGGPPGTIRGITWLMWTPTRGSYNVLPELPAGKVFANAAPPVVDYASSTLTRTATASLDAEGWRRALPGPTLSGVLKVSAELLTDRGTEYTARVEIRQSTGTGFRAGLSEQFGLPYVFGAGFLRRGDLSGPDTGVGNDCANFLVYAWRRNGFRLPWSNPAQLRRYLVPLARDARFPADILIPEGAVERGVVVHFGSHVAALWEDREPAGKLGPDDLVAHHLGGAPEILTVGELLSRRADRSFDVYVAPLREARTWIAVGGDVMPADLTAPRTLQRALARADLVVANLETTVGAEPPPEPRRYAFTIDAERLTEIRGIGIRAVNLANNHIADFGARGLQRTLEALHSHQLGSFGAGADLVSASRPLTIELGGLTIAFVGVFVSTPTESPLAFEAAGLSIPKVPRDLHAIAESLAAAKASADCVIVVPHWGSEGDPSVDDDQRRWARWLVEHGADAIVGSGPHVIQSFENVEGVPVFYSTGNLWFAGPWPKGSRQAGIAFLGLDDRGRVVEARLESIPAARGSATEVTFGEVSAPRSASSATQPAAARPK